MGESGEGGGGKRGKRGGGKRGGSGEGEGKRVCMWAWACGMPSVVTITVRGDEGKRGEKEGEAGRGKEGVCVCL
mgnify:CR=1 FL=1